MINKIIIEIPKELEGFYTCIATDCNYPVTLVENGKTIKNPQSEEDFVKEQILNGIKRCYADGKAKLKAKELIQTERVKALDEIKDLKISLTDKKG